MEFSKYRVVVIDEKGNISAFPYTIGKQHQECLEDYAYKHNYEYSSVEYLTRQNNIIFYNADKTMYLCYMPKELSDEQLELLDRLSLKMDDIKYIEVRKYLEEGYTDFMLGHDIGRRFSDEVIQSYFINDKNKTA